MSKKSGNKFILYYFPTSYSSQKVLFALFEKDVVFKPKLVSLFSGQHNEPWYVKLNPNGYHIPVLNHGGKIIVDPTNIINHINQQTECAGGHSLVPSQDSELGKNVDIFRQQLDSIPVDILTYGIIYHPHLSSSGCQLPYATQRSMKDNFEERLSLLTDLASKHPELRDGYLAKSQTAAYNFDIITDATEVQAHLDDLKPLFTKIEQQLKNIKEGGIDISDELWLFGPMFTAADISLAILLHRLTLLGLDSTFFSAQSSPCIHQYYYQIRKRPAFQKIEKEIENIKWTLMWENTKAASPIVAGVVGIAALIGTGVYIYKKSCD